MKSIFAGLGLLAVVGTLVVFFLFNGGVSPGANEEPVVKVSNQNDGMPDGAQSDETDVPSVNLPIVSSHATDPEAVETVNDPSERNVPLSPFETLRMTISDLKDAEELDVDALFESLAQGLPGLDRKERSQILSTLGEVIAMHPDSTNAVLEGLDTFQDKGMVVRAAIKQLVDLEPQLAADWSLELQDPSMRRLAVNRMSAAWAETDLDSAINWAAELEDRQDLATALDGITWTWAQNDPNAAYEYASLIEDDFFRNQMFLSIAKMMSYKDPVGTTEWAAQFPTGTQERERALSYSLFQWASKDIMGAVDFALALDDPKVRDSGLLSVARSWAVQDPAAATEWAESFEDESLKRQAWASSAVQWAQKDPQGLAEWMQDRPVEQLQGHVMRQAVSVIGRNDPQIAQDWIQNLATPELQQAGSDALFELQQRQVKLGQ